MAQPGETWTGGSHGELLSNACLEDPCGSPQFNKQYWIPIKNSLTLEILNYGQECPVTLVWLYTISKHPIFTKVLTLLMLETENSGCRDTMSADALAPKVARASAGMILAVQDRRFIVPGVISTICVKPNPRYNPNVNISFAISSTHWNQSLEIIFFPSKSKFMAIIRHLHIIQTMLFASLQKTIDLSGY